MPTKRFKMGHRRSSDHQSRPPRKPEQHVVQYHFDSVREMQDIMSTKKYDTIDDPESALKAYGIQLTHVTCAKCETPLLPDAKSAAKLAERLTEIDPSGFFSCPNCPTRTCIGCGMTTRALRRQSQTGLCCPDSQLFCVWIWLCALETPHIANDDVKMEKIEHDTARAVPEASRPGTTARKPNGTGYGGHNSYSGAHVDYTEDEFSPEPPASVVYAQIQAHRHASFNTSTTKPIRDQILLPRLFRALKALIPGYFSPTAYDLVPSSLLGIMLERSRAIEAIATLLRTDSFEEMELNSELFCSILDIVARLAYHSSLASLVIGPRQVYPVEEGLLKTTIPQPHESLNIKRTPEQVTPIIQLLDKFFHATSKIRNQALKIKDEFSDQEGQQLLRVCERADTVYHSVQRSVKGLNLFDKSNILEETGSASPTAQQMVKWHREHCVDSVDDDVFKIDFHFSKERKSKDQPTKGRMKRLLTEIATLQSALPEGVFVRYASSRPDLMKVLIIGPRDTPYEQGVFEFDMVCPLNYPQAAPKMHFKTTGNGRAHFNPNLYPDGKVCLSLLGTWNGPAWVPKESTILQVLVSIQAMIFCAEPWYNEPGRESRQMEDQSRRFNIEVQTLTIRHALTETLRQAAETQDRGCWQEVINKHFCTYGVEILETLKDWQKKAEKMPDRIGKRYTSVLMPPMPQQPFIPGQWTASGEISPAYPQSSFAGAGNMFSSSKWQQTGWPAGSPTYAPHPHYMTSPMKSTLGIRLAALANHHHSPLVLPVPGEDMYTVDPVVPQKFQALLHETAAVTGFPLVVLTNQHSSWIPESAPKNKPDDSFYLSMFQAIVAATTHDLPDESASIPYMSHQSLQSIQSLADNPKSKLNPTSLATDHQMKHIGTDIAQTYGYSEQTKKMFSKLSKEMVMPNEVQKSGSSAIFGSSKVSIPDPATESFAALAVPDIPEYCFTDDEPLLLTEWLEPMISQYQSLKKNLPPSSPAYIALESKQTELLKKANSNKWYKTFTIEEFAESVAFSDSDFDDDISVYGSAQGKTGLQKEIEGYEKTLKEFLRSD